MADSARQDHGVSQAVICKILPGSTLSDLSPSSSQSCEEGASPVSTSVTETDGTTVSSTRAAGQAGKESALPKSTSVTETVCSTRVSGHSNELSASPASTSLTETDGTTDGNTKAAGQPDELSASPDTTSATKTVVGSTKAAGQPDELSASPDSTSLTETDGSTRTACQPGEESASPDLTSVTETEGTSDGSEKAAGQPGEQSASPTSSSVTKAVGSTTAAGQSDKLGASPDTSVTKTVGSTRSAGQSDKLSASHGQSVDPESVAETNPKTGNIQDPSASGGSVTLVLEEGKNTGINKAGSKCVSFPGKATRVLVGIEKSTLTGSDVQAGVNSSCVTSKTSQDTISIETRAENHAIASECFPTSTAKIQITESPHHSASSGGGEPTEYQPAEDKLELGGKEETHGCLASGVYGDGDGDNELNVESFIFVSREGVPANHKNEPASVQSEGSLMFGFKKKLLGAWERHLGKGQKQEGNLDTELRECDVDKKMQVPAEGDDGLSCMNKEYTTGIKEGASRQEVSRDQDISRCAQKKKSGNCHGNSGVTDKCCTDDDHSSPASGQHEDDPFPNDTVYVLCFKTDILKDDPIFHTLPNKILYYRWLYIADSLMDTLGKEQFSWSLHENMIVIESTKPVAKQSVPKIISIIDKEITSLTVKIKSFKLNTGAKSEVIRSMLTKKFEGQELAVIVSEKKQKLLLFSNNSNVAKKAEYHVGKYLHRKVGSSQQIGLQTGKEENQTPPEWQDSEEQNTWSHEMNQDISEQFHQEQTGRAFGDADSKMLSRSTSTSAVKDHQEYHSDAEEGSTSVGFGKLNCPSSFGRQMEGDARNARPADASGGLSCMSDPVTRPFVLDKGTAECELPNSASPVATTIPITKAQAKFLQQKEIQLVFIKKLMGDKLSIDILQLENQLIVVTAGDTGKVRSILEAMMQTETLAVDEGDQEVCGILSDLQEKFGEHVLIESQKDTVVFVFDSGIAEQVKPYIQNVKVTEIKYPLPTGVMQYMQSHMQQLAEVLKKIKKLEVNIELAKDENNLTSLLVKTDRVHLWETRKIVDRLLAKLCQRKLSVEFGVGCALQSSSGRLKVAKMEQSNNVSIHVKVPGHNVLLTAQSPLGHQILVCEGSVAVIDSHVIVLPVCDRQKEWPPVFKWILKKGFLSTDPSLYAAQLKLSEAKTLILDCQGANSGRQVVVMHVPSADSGKFKHDVHERVKEALNSALSKHQNKEDLCLALPLTLYGRANDWKWILPAVLETLAQKSDKTVTVKLFPDQAGGTDLKVADIVSDMHKYLSSPQHCWSTNVSSAGVDCPVPCRIKVIVADICCHTILEMTDVLVNSTDPKLSHTLASASSQMLKKAGDGLTAECEREYPEGIGKHLIAITEGHCLKPVKQIFHIVLLQNTWKASEEESLLDDLRDKMTACLVLASCKQYENITFPTLGTGKLKYPPDKVAETMFATAQDFFADMPHSSLQVVYIVCYHADPAVIQSFEEKEKLFTQPGHRPRAKERKSKKNGKDDVPQIAAHVQVCGEKTAVEKTVQQILDIPIPEHYKEIVKLCQSLTADQSQDDSQSEKDMKGGVCKIVIPNYCLKNASLKKILIDLPVECQPSSSSTEFQVTFEDLQKTVTAICEGVGSWPLTEQPKEEKKADAKAATEESTTWSKAVDELQVAALKFLLGAEFDDSFDVQQKKGTWSISLRGASSRDLVSKVESLRQEDVQLSASELSHLGDNVDVRAEGIEAFIKTVPDQAKAVVFAFDYSAVTKAKHLLAVKAGRVKVTARSRRRFDAGNPGAKDSLKDQSPPHSLTSVSPQSGPSVKTTDFVTRSGIKVSVYKTDITKLPVDAIVNAANKQLAHGGGVAAAIARAAGYSLEDEGQDYIKTHGLLKVSEVAVTTAGSLPCKKVLHAVGPCWYDYTDKLQCQQHLVDTVFNCLSKASSLGFSSVAIPSISSAIFGVPQHICAESYLLAVKRFEDMHGSSTRLRCIHFVDVSDGMVTIIQNTFTAQWSMTDMSGTQQIQHPALSMTDMSGTQQIQHPALSMTDTSGTQQIQHPALSMTDTSGTQQIQRPALSMTDTSGTQQIQRPTSETMSKPMESNIQSSASPENKAQGPVCSPSSSPLSGCEPEGFPYLQLTEDKTVPFQIGFRFQNLALIFQSQSVEKTETDAVVLWQDLQNVMKDQISKYYTKKLEGQVQRKVSDMKKILTTGGKVHCVDTGNKLLVFPVVPTFSSQGKDKIRDLVEQVLNKVDLAQKRSIAIPRFQKKTKGKKDANNKDADAFIGGLYAAVKRYAERPKRSITEVHIVETDHDTLKSMMEIANDLVGMDRSVMDQRSSQPAAAASPGNRPSRPKDPCVICTEEPIVLKSLSCGHTFCTECIDKWLKTRAVCPTCNESQGVQYGNQPVGGTMQMIYSHYYLQGFQFTGSYTISYNFSSGKQVDEHPFPGQRYSGTQRTAYLPDTREGRTVLMLLKVAFDRRLIFTVDQSATTGQVGIIWNDIHHKTNQSGGPECHGYPDPSYLMRVMQELADKGVTEKDLTATQRDFIQNPHKYRSCFDFSKYFRPEGTAV